MCIFEREFASENQQRKRRRSKRRVRQSNERSQGRSFLGVLGRILSRAFPIDQTVERSIKAMGHPGVLADYRRAKRPSQLPHTAEEHIERDRSRKLPEENTTSSTGYGTRWI